ncbi:MAG: methyl-accepting chemotaxis protein [Hyphomonadaceae bacterium]
MSAHSHSGETKMNSINRAALIASGSIFGLVALSGLCGLWTQNELQGALDESGRAANLIRAHMSADMMHDALRSDVLAAISAQDPRSGIAIDEVRADFSEHTTEFRSQIAEEARLAATDAERDAIAGVAAPLNAYIAKAEEVITLAGSDPQAALGELPEFFEQFRALEGQMEAVTDVISAGAATSTSHAEDDAHFSFWLMLSVLIASGAATIALAVMTRRHLVAPLVSLTNQMTRLADGDNTVDPVEAKRTDEIGAMGRALVTFRGAALARIEADRQAERDRIAAQAAQERARDDARVAAEELVARSFGEGMAKLADGNLTFRITQDVPQAYEKLRADFNAAVAKLEDAMGAIAANADGMRAGTGEISQASDDLSRRTEQQAATLEETAAALDEVTATVGKTAEGARQANGAVQTTRENAAKSGEIVKSAVGAMEAIEQSSRQISQIIGVIDEIAFQTNLLALNAGVEAARAGDAGRGFAVVASEVRALAQRSAEAAKEIKSLISTSSQQVDTGVKLVGQAGEALTRIVTGVNEINGLVSEIASSAQEQSTALTQVNAAINQMDQTTQQNAAMVEESTAASHALAHEAQQLEQLVARFEISQVGGAPRVAANPNSVRHQQQRVAAYAAKPTRRIAMPKSSAAPSAAAENWEEF